MGENDRPALNIHAVLSDSRVNGPGARMVVFFQGCARGCRGCFNPDTHPDETRDLLTVDQIFQKYYSGTIEGITVSGGEPFRQPEGLRNLLSAAREVYGLTTVVYTGYLHEELKGSPTAAECLKFIDVLIDGPYDEENKEETLLARGSTNQKFHFLTSRYTVDDFYMPGRVEVTIRKDGTVTETGFSRIEVK
ncbi:MAG: radical SAM protein [Nitrospirota bacterium]|nr:radical SAM protein [Nitrospirota bacterium]